MRRHLKKISSVLLLCGLPLALAATEVLPPQLAEIAALQSRMDKLALGEIGANNYHLTKARIWLDMATSEYHQTDTSGTLPAAIAQAEGLITALENKQTNISTDMPTDFPGSEKVRPDLWEKIAAIKNKGHYECGQRQLAEGEVQLVWAGHEKVESGWSHAESYAKIAEDSITEAQAAINICNNAPMAMVKTIAPPSVKIIAPVAIVPAAEPAPHRVVEKMTLSADALFNFDSIKLTRYSREKLDKLVRDIKMINTLDEINLVGHSDRLRTDKKYLRNQALSERRAQRIKQYLVSEGIPANKIKASGAGSHQPVVQCSNKPPKAKQVICLQPNRRVEISILGVKY